MSQQLQDLRAAAAIRRQQQQEQSRAPLRSPDGFEFDVASVASLRSAASSRRSQMRRGSYLSHVATAKSEQFGSVISEYERPSELEHGENEDPNMYDEVQSGKSVVHEEENTQQHPPHKEKQFSEKCRQFSLRNLRKIEKLR